VCPERERTSRELFVDKPFEKSAYDDSVPPMR